MCDGGAKQQGERHPDHRGECQANPESRPNNVHTTCQRDGEPAGDEWPCHGEEPRGALVDAVALAAEQDEDTEADGVDRRSDEARLRLTELPS